MKETACPSRIGGDSLKNYSDPRIIIANANLQIGFLTDQLYSLIDGGNTEELNFEVLISIPDEGLELRQELLSDSPYLSDTIMKQAIYKEDVLPNAMIRDILQANPQSAKSDDILSTLEERFEPMPDYMMAQILEGKKHLGSKEILEAEIQSWKQIRERAKSELFRQYLLDTNIINPVDSIIVFLENENDLESKYELAFAYWNRNDTLNALDMLDDIPVNFTLNNNQLAVYDQYIDYFDLLKMMEDSNFRATDLDSASLEILFDLMVDGAPKIAAFSRGLLVKGGFFDYIETIIIPEYNKNSVLVYNPKGIQKAPPQAGHLKLFPNPAGDYVIVYYDLESIDPSGMISFLDLKGSLIKSYIVEIRKNQIVIDLKDLPNGLYIVGLISDGKLLGAEKLCKGRD